MWNSFKLVEHKPEHRVSIPEVMTNEEKTELIKTLIRRQKDIIPMAQELSEREEKLKDLAEIIVEKHSRDWSVTVGRHRYSIKIYENESSCYREVRGLKVEFLTDLIILDDEELLPEPKGLAKKIIDEYWVVDQLQCELDAAREIQRDELREYRKQCYRRDLFLDRERTYKEDYMGLFQSSTFRPKFVLDGEVWEMETSWDKIVSRYKCTDYVEKDWSPRLEKVGDYHKESEVKDYVEDD